MAHEINNPIGFVLSNMRSLQSYFEQLIPSMDVRNKIPYDSLLPTKIAPAENIAFMLEDIPNLLRESLTGI